MAQFQPGRVVKAASEIDLGNRVLPAGYALVVRSDTGTIVTVVDPAQPGDTFRVSRSEVVAY